MIPTRIYLSLATLGLLIGPIFSLPQAISFGGQADDVALKSGNRRCSEFCSQDYTPVCGTDGKTYSNKCKLEQKACNDNSNLRLDYSGECRQGTDDRLCNNKRCGQQCDSSFGLLQVVRYCQADGSCGTNSQPNCEGSGNSEDDDIEERRTQSQNCCCVHVSRACPNPFNNNNNNNRPTNHNNNGGNGGFLSAASPRINPNQEIDDGDIGSRIVNKPTVISQQQKEREFYCESNERACCYSSPSTLSNVVSQSRCITRSRPSSKEVLWNEQCSSNQPRNIRQGEKRCGERRFREISGKKQGQSNPSEFPWACLVLDGNNNFIGACAIIPDNRFNDVRSGTDRVIMAAHKLKDVRRNDKLKIRVIEWDASGFKQVENTRHQEYQVDNVVRHPQYDADRLSYDVAVLKVVTRPDNFGGIKGRIDLTQTDDVNAACLPGCDDQFDYQFRNQSGVRCWVAGWGKDGKDGSFQVIQNKVDVPLMSHNECQFRMKQALGRDAGRNFLLSESEICAGGEEGKDACDGDGGAPLVCQSKDNRWNVVGLVTWGVDCARKGVPGVYANVYNMLDFILRA